jgi:hypothetical protein
MYKILASLNVASNIPLDYLRAVQLLSELELTINYVVELVLDELEIKSTFPFASAAKDHVQRLREGKLLDYGTLPGQAEYVAHRLLGMNPGIGAGSIECFVSIFDQSWTMTSLKMVSDFYNYPFDVQAGISPNLYLLFDRAAIIQDELPQEHPAIKDESILILAQAMIHSHISSSVITGNPQAPLREWEKFHEMAKRAVSCNELKQVLSANISKLRLGAVSGYDISLAVVAAAEAETQDAEMPPDKFQKAGIGKAKGKQAKSPSPPSQSSKSFSQTPSLAEQFEVEGSRAVSRKNWPVSKPGAITERVNESKHSQDKTGVGRFSQMSNAEFGRFVLKLFAELKVSTEDQSKLCRVVGDAIIFNSYVNSEGKRKTTWIDQKLYDRLTPFQRAAFAEMKTRTINYAKQLKGESVSRISSEDKSKVKASSGKSFSKSKSKRGARVNLSAAASDSESGSQTSSRSSSKSDASLREFLDLDRDQLHSESEMEPSRMDRKKWLSSRSSTGRTQREREDFFDSSFERDRDRLALLDAVRAIRDLDDMRQRDRQRDSQRLEREFALGHEGISDEFARLQLEHKQLSKKMQEFEKKRQTTSRGSEDSGSVFSDQDGLERRPRSAFSAFAPSRSFDKQRGDDVSSEGSESRPSFRGGDLSSRELQFRSRAQRLSRSGLSSRAKFQHDEDMGEEDDRFEPDRSTYEGRSKHNHA